MISPGHDTATQRYLNALALFDEFVRTAASAAPDAAALRGLERRFAERIEIQPSYWSQIKGRSRQIGERLARQFEQRCGKPAGWLDHPHGVTVAATAATAPSAGVPPRAPETGTPRDEDERFITELVLTYYRRNPQRARQRLLDLLGEVLAPVPTPAPPPPPPPSAVDADAALWARARQSIAPLKKKH
ncbi:hypothetical protein [Sphaerotilus sp.]|jgi:hypothetical protein|uniref:hypothetical protein n=1 Tax=Sphaerotilus sp. TaxID=2093942 RepID=UPI00286DD523|nr:hypothetical protein [Sphaerotilus sp.]